MGIIVKGQKLEDVRKLLLDQLEEVKKGAFDDWMIDAVVRSFKKDLMVQMERNWIRAYYMSDAFILNENWEDVINRYDRMQKITKDELVSWANTKFKDNYAAVNKRQGEKNVQKVDKPEITQVQINRDAASPFFEKISSMNSMRLEPMFIDYNTAIKKESIKNLVPMNYVQNDVNEIYNMYYVFEMGKRNDPWIPLAFKYLPYLGTDDMSPAEVQKELFRLGLDFDVSSSLDRSYVIVSGLQENFEEGVAFFEKLLSSVIPNQESYDEMISGLLKERADKKLSKGQILFNGMSNYAKYGPQNPMNTVISEDELRKQDPKILAEMLRSLTVFEHRILFYGPQSIETVKAVLEKNHTLPSGHAHDRSN